MLETSCQRLGKALLTDLSLCSIDGIGNTVEVCPTRREVEHEVCGPRVTVPRLPDRAGVDQPPVRRGEVELGRVRGKTPTERFGLEGDGKRDVAVPDEDERLVGRSERAGRRLGGEHILPDGVARARVVEADAVARRRRLEGLEELAMTGLEHRGCPAGALRRVRLELREFELPEDRKIVVSDEAQIGPLTHEGAAGVRLRSVAYEVPQAPGRVGTLAVDRLQHRFERMQVSVNVRDDADAHRRRRTVAKAVGVLVAAGTGAFAAALLWQTAVPDLDLPRVDPHTYFEQGELERIERFRTVTRGLWAAWIALELVVLAALVWKARTLAAQVKRFARGRVRTGVGVGLIAVLAVWGARLPVAGVWHWWERRYGLSRQSYPAWLGDQAISAGVRAALVSLAVAGAIALAVRLGPRWWVAGAPALVAVAILFVLAQPLVIQPLFNRFEPLADRSLAARIETTADRMGVDLERVDVADASRRTTAGNAYVAGIGPTRRVVLYDTILDGRFRDDEVVAISAHELAHVARRHLWKGLAWFALLAVPGLYLIARVTEPRGGLRDPALVPLALLFALALFLATLPLQNAVSRRYEAEADWLALEATGDAAAAVELDRRLVRSSLGDPDPPAWTKLFLATHPSALDRIAMAEAFRAREAR